MTYNLEHLAQTRKTILLAEIAGLLHNLGKLSPNSDILSFSKSELGERYLYCPRYRFDRFAAPDTNLLRAEVREVLEHHAEDEATLRHHLQTQWTEEELTAFRALVAVHEAEDELVEKAMEAAWQLKQWLQSNGPLFRCFTAQRKKDRQRITERLQVLDTEIADAKRAGAGERIGELYQEKSSLERQQDTAMPLPQLYQRERKAQKQREKQFRDLALSVTGERWSLADLLTLFWDDFFWKPSDDDEADYKRVPVLTLWLKREQSVGLPGLLILSHGEVSGAEKNLLLLDERGKSVKAQPSKDDLTLATAFGYDRPEVLRVWTYHDRRHELINLALEISGSLPEKRNRLVTKAKDTLQLGLGDTQWPINEIDLWDYASSIAALFKSSVARAVLDEAIPSVDAMRWRFLSVRFDGLAYLSQAHHVTDLLGRRDSLDVALDAVQTLLEETYPLGNEIYRDENGAVFVVPAWEAARSTLALVDESEQSLEGLLAQTFRDAMQEKSGEQKSLPPFDGGLEPFIEEGDSVRGKGLQLGTYLKNRAHPLTAEPARMAVWWRDKQAQGQEVCTVCGVRPVGYRPEDVDFPGWVKTKNARDRHICCICLHRRGRRAEQWLKHEFSTTIWADEVVDENGRFALLVGQFELQHWLDGTLIPSMQKPDSFARVQRVWETTRTFWDKIQTELLPSNLEKRDRLEIHPTNVDVLKKVLAGHNTYELEIEGLRAGVLWDPLSERLLLTENLADLARRWNIAVDNDDELVPAMQKWLRQQTDSPWSLYEPSGYAEPRAEKEASVKFESASGGEIRYTPYVPLLTEPALFLALIPANKAMDVVAAIRRKYEQEMSKVQDRLPLHLSVIIAKRRTPLRAVLDAGRAMLEHPSTWEKWTVEARSNEVAAPDHLSDDAHFARWWKLELKNGDQTLTLRVADRMGDGETEDRWHAHFVIKNPEKDTFDPRKDVMHVSDLSKGTTIYMKPATFDFEYLDTTARRFNISYDDDGQRRGRPSRPYLLNNVETIAEVWRVLNEHLKSSQWMWIHGLIEEKRRDWQQPRGPVADYASTFERFVKDTLRQAEWKDKRAPEEDDFDLLKTAAVHGVLADVIDLYHEALKLGEKENRKESA